VTTVDPTRYSIRHSARAKHVHLKVTLTDGVIVVVPRGFDVSLLPELVERERGWIQRQQARFGDAPLRTVEQAASPQTIDLPACAESWQVDYVPRASARTAVTECGDSVLLVRGAADDEAGVQAALKRWLARRARRHLVAQLDLLSAQHGLSYARTTIRYQRSRWGSCSSRGTISLNARLLFLPADLVRYVLTHELCHTAHLNHGPEFWELVGELQPHHRALHRTLREGWKRIPLWALA